MTISGSVGKKIQYYLYEAVLHEGWGQQDQDWVRKGKGIEERGEKATVH